MTNAGHRHNNRLVRLRPGAALCIAAGAAATFATTPAFGLAEAIRTICPSGLSGVSCPWYEGGGPIINTVLDDPIITGERSIVGLISGLFPLSTHEALSDDLGDSRIDIEISVSSINGGDGDPSIQAHIDLRSDATGMLHAAMGNGLPREPDPLARGVAFDARAYAAAVASAISPTGLYQPNLAGTASALLAMTHQPTADSLDIDETADVVVTDLSFVGDYEAEGYLARSFDAIAFLTGVTIVAGTGDGADAVFPPDQQDLRFRTIGIPAGGFNVMGVGSFSTPDMGNSTTYITASDFSGQGRLDARDWRSIDLDEPAGYTIVTDSRFGVDVGAPGMKLRLATAEGEGAYSRGIEFPIPEDNPLPGGDDEELGSEGTRFAAAITAGGVALLQDAYKALIESGDPRFQHWIQPRMPNYAVRALFIASAFRTPEWTNVGNHGQGNDEIEEVTQQPLDTAEGGGRLALRGLFEQFQGRVGLNGLPPQPATMDHPFTRPDIPFVRLPPNVGPRADGDDPDLGGIGGVDPPLGGGGGGNPPVGPYIPDPFLRPRPQNPNLPQPPNTDFLLNAIDVRSIGWDIGNVGAGFLDYAIIDPLSPEGVLTATLVWNRIHKINVPNVAAGETLQIPGDEESLELENLDLVVFSGDGSGQPRFQVALSSSEWNNVEHVILQNPPTTGEYILRVQWVERHYDVYDEEFVGDQPFAISWKFDVQQADDAPPLITGPVGDLNFDGFVTMEDVQMVLQAFGTANSAADINDDGIVNFFDLNIVLSAVQTQSGGGDDEL